MKYVFALLLLAGLAFAEPESTPEADPAAEAWYGYYGLGYRGYRGYYGGYGGYYGRPYGYGYGYYGRKKREADPAVLATTHAAPAVAPLVHPYGYALGYGYGLHHAPTVGYTVEHKNTEVIPGSVTAVAGTPTVVHVAGYGGYGYGYWGRKKREADPAVVAIKHSAPTAVIPPPVPYGLGENFLAPAAPHLHTVEHKGTEVIPGAVAEGTTPVGYAAPYAHGWGYGYGLHHPLLVAAPAAAEAAVTDARKKREAAPEAEAEADPAVLYSGYYGHPYAYGYGLGGYYGGYGGYAGRGYYGYGGLGYAYYG